MPNAPAPKPPATPKPVSAEALGTLMRCAAAYASISDSYLAISLPEVFTEATLANASTETLTLMYGDIRKGLDAANKAHKYYGNAATHLVWEAIASRIGNMVTSRNQPTWRARPR